MKKLPIIVMALMLASQSLPLWSQSEKLTNREEADLIYVLEEKKLASEMYTAFEENWDGPIFKFVINIENRQLAAIEHEIKKKHLELPIAVSLNNQGTFMNSEWQKLYINMIPQMAVSEVEAMQALATLEEKEIKMLDEAIDHTENVDLIILYDQIRVSARRDLSTIYKALAEQGIKYQPSVLTREEFEGLVGTVL